MTNRNWLRFAAVGLVAGPFLFTLADLFRRLVAPGASATDRQLTAAVAQHPSLWGTAAVLSVVAALAFLPGVVGLVLTARGRGVRLTTVGGLAVSAGLVASVGHAVGYYGPFGRYADSGVSAASVSSLQSADGDPSTVVCIVLFMLGLMLGSIVLMLGLHRAGLVPVWSVLAVVVFVGSGSTGGVAAGTVGLVAALAAFTPAARSLLRGGADSAPGRSTAGHLASQ